MPTTVRGGDVDLRLSAGRGVERRLGLAPGIAVEHEDLREVGPGGRDQLEAIHLGTREGVLVRKHHALGERREQDERKESLARVAHGARAGIEAEALLVAVDGRPSVFP